MQIKPLYSSAFVIFYNDNEDFIKAVESHVSVLRHQNLDVISIHQPCRELWDCCLAVDRHAWIDKKLKNRTVIIYMSPNMNEMFMSGDLEHAQAMDEAGEACHYALQYIAKRLSTFKSPDQSSNVPTVRLVTFGCFDLSSPQGLVREFIFPGTEFNLEYPLEIAECGQDGLWRLVRMDQFLCDINHGEERSLVSSRLIDSHRIQKGIEETERLITRLHQKHHNSFTRTLGREGSSFLKKSTRASPGLHKVGDVVGDVVEGQKLESDKMVTNAPFQKLVLWKRNNGENCHSSSVSDLENTVESEIDTQQTCSEARGEQCWWHGYVIPPRIDLSAHSQNKGESKSVLSLSSEAFYTDLRNINNDHGW